MEKIKSILNILLKHPVQSLLPWERKYRKIQSAQLIKY